MNVRIGFTAIVMAFAGTLLSVEAEPSSTNAAIGATTSSQPVGSISESDLLEHNASMELVVLEPPEVAEGLPRSDDDGELISANPVSSFQAKPKTIKTRIDPSAVRREPVEAVSDEELCNALVASARAHDVPVGFFGNLIWQESRFDSGSISRAGAQGVAQFMPGTAAQFGLKNPLDPFEALPASARLLRQLSKQFGNFGLAAAAYNAGPGRVIKWLANRGELPRETRAYVRIITGRPAEDWRGSGPTEDSAKIADQLPCRDMPAFAELIAKSAPTENGAKSAPRVVNVATLMSRRPRQRSSTKLESKVTQEVGLKLLKATTMPAKLRKLVAREATSDRPRSWLRTGKKKIPPVASAKSGRSV